MKDFLIGLAIGALGAYVAVKLSDEETRNKIKEEIDYGVALGKSTFSKAQDVVTQEISKGKETLDKVTTNVQGKLSDGLADLSQKIKP